MQKLLIPLSIVLAGAFIAGAIYFTQSNNPNTAANPNYKAIRTVQNDEHILGNADADVIIFEYTDPECPYCKVFHETMRGIVSDMQEQGNSVAWVYRHFPIPQLHPKAPVESQALECAAAQGGNDMFWQYTNALYAQTLSNNSLDIGVYNSPATIPVDQATGEPYYTEGTPRSETDAGQLSDLAVSLGLDQTQFEQCLKDGTYAERVEKDAAEAVAAGAQGTPFNIAVAKKNLSDKAKEAIAQIPANYGIVLLDKKSVAIPGAFPKEAVESVINMMLDKPDAAAAQQ